MKNIFFSTGLVAFFLTMSGVLSATERCLLPRLFRPAAPATPIVEAPPFVQPVVQSPVVVQPYVPSVVYTPPLVPTTQIVSSPLVITERILSPEPTIPVRISSETVRDTLVSYDTPYMTSVSDGLVTTVYEPVPPISTEVAEVRFVENRVRDEGTAAAYSVSMPVERSELTILQPLMEREEATLEIRETAHKKTPDAESIDSETIGTTTPEPEEETIAENPEILTDPTEEQSTHDTSDQRERVEASGAEKALVLKPAISEEELSAILTGLDLSEPKGSDLIRSPVPPPAPTLLGQSPMDLRGAMSEALSTRPQLPQGLPSQSVIPESLLDGEETASDPTLLPSESGLPNESGASVSGKGEGPKGLVSTGASRTNGVLLIATIVSIVMTIYVLMLAFDYYQRWMQSLTARSDRYAGSWGEGIGLSFSAGDLYDTGSYMENSSDGLGISPSLSRDILGSSKY